MARQKSKLWFIPIRIHCAPATRIVEAKSIEDAESALKKDELYYKNFISFSCDRQNELYEKSSKSFPTGMIDIFELEDDFFERWGKAADKIRKKFTEEIPECKLRYWNKRFGGEYFCKGFDPKETSAANRYCIIHDGHLKFDMPSDCPYLKQESKYIQFTE